MRKLIEVSVNAAKSPVLIEICDAITFKGDKVDFCEEKMEFTVAGGQFEYQSDLYHHGIWPYRSLYLHVDEVISVINHLARSDGWHVTEGVILLYDLVYANGREISITDLNRAIYDPNLDYMVGHKSWQLWANKSLFTDEQWQTGFLN